MGQLQGNGQKNQEATVIKALLLWTCMAPASPVKGEAQSYGCSHSLKFF